MFRRLLVANRGEIAARVLTACRAMGIETVAVHSTADADSPHLALADRTMCIGPAPASRSYLDMDAVLQAAAQSECQAVHPGYGFLAENALFAARCAAQNLTFIGPRAGIIRAMGDKVEARQTMKTVGLPVIPGSDGVTADIKEAIRVAGDVGYPVFLKASAGGGGKGMRMCENEAELKRAFPEASNEADKSFGNPALYLEKAIVGGRHIEFQILADTWGNALHLGERECSVQRRHQKLVEEALSPAMNADARDRMGSRVARAVADLGYTGAGTVEFLRNPDGALYFMEMNTRLQVEHPVTEAITGVDIVREQIRIAANETLPVTQDEITFDGHAIEMRINAEDPDDDFKPCPGTITQFTCSDTARLDTHINLEGAGTYTVPPYYDSLLAKLIVHGKNRKKAIAAGLKALDSLEVEGVKTTAPLHRRILEHPDFVSGDYDVTIMNTMPQGV